MQNYLYFLVNFCPLQGPPIFVLEITWLFN